MRYSWLLAALPVIAMPGLGQTEDIFTPEGEDGYVLDEILVTAGHTPIAARDYGRAYSVVTAKEIERRQIRTVAEALRALPGVSVNRTGGPGGRTQVRLRGAEGNHVLVLIDGIEVSAPQSGEYDFAGLTASGIERIEVLRGPQSALYGSNAMAGVISIITKRGKPGSFGAGGFVEGGSNASRAASAWLRGGNEVFDIALDASYRLDDGFDISDDPTDIADQNELMTFSGKAHWRPTEDLTIGGVFRATRRESELDSFNFGAPDRDDLVTEGDDSLRKDEIAGSVWLELDTLGGRLTHRLRADYTNVHARNFTAGTPSSDMEGKRFKASWQGTLALDAPTVARADHKLTFAGEWERETFRNLDPALVFDPSQLTRQERTMFGIAAEYQGRFLDALDVQLGLRHDFNDAFKDTTTFSAGLSYFIDATGTRLHGSVGTGVTNPTFYEQFGFNPASFLGNPALKPEESFGWDIGVEQGFLDDRLIIDVTYFRERLKNEIVTAYPAPAFVATPVNEDGTSKRQGIEVSVDFMLIEGLTLGLGYTWLDAEDPDGEIEVRRPKHEGRLTASYAFLGGDAVITADARMVLGNHDTDFTAPSMGTATIRLDDYVVVNVAGSYQINETVEFFARVENLTDTDYQEVDGYVAPGITAYSGFRLTF